MGKVCCVRMSLTPKDQELACSYAVCVLHDSGAEVSGDQIAKLLKAANCEVEPYWPMLFASLPSEKIASAMTNVSGGGGGGGAAGGDGATGGDAPAEESEEEEEMAPAMDMFGGGGG